MSSSINSPKEPSKIVGWSLILFACIFGIGIAILVFVIGSDIGGGIGGAIQGGSALLFFYLPLKIIKYGRQRMAERADTLLKDVLDIED